MLTDGGPAGPGLEEVVPTENVITPIAEYPAIGLDELVAAADLQTRKDRKYMLPATSAAELLGEIEARALEIDELRSFRYESVYFDTEAWDSYLLAARRRPSRFKVRTRSYLDSGECMLEVKVRDHRGNTVKHRATYDIESRDVLTPEGAEFVASIDAARPYVDQLRPVLTVSYRRSTLILEEDGARVTIDAGVLWERGEIDRIGLPDHVLIETKTAGHTCCVDRALWRFGHRPVTISKFATGVAALERSLPSNKWHRILSRHLLPNAAS